MLQCPCCASGQNTVLDSRPTDQSVRRRRKCLKCGERWTTYEVTAGAFEALVNIDAALDTARKGVADVTETLDRLRLEGRLIRDDFGLKPYHPVEIGSRRYTPEDGLKGSRSAQEKARNRSSGGLAS